jgi:hypothetical protein
MRFFLSSGPSGLIDVVYKILIDDIEDLPEQPKSCLGSLMSRVVPQPLEFEDG